MRETDHALQHLRAEDDPASAPLVKYAKHTAKELRGQMVRRRINLQLS